MKIMKGAQVRLQTTNGGDSIVTLLEDYVPTYSALMEGSGGWFRVSAGRIKSIEVVSLNAEYVRKTKVAARMAESAYSNNRGLEGMHAELAFLRRSDADPVVIAEFERLYHNQIKLVTPLTHALRERVAAKQVKA